RAGRGFAVTLSPSTSKRASPKSRPSFASPIGDSAAPRSGALSDFGASCAGFSCGASFLAQPLASSDAAIRSAMLSFLDTALEREGLANMLPKIHEDARRVK